ncbi:MAG: acetate CoA-transferase alpha subunit [Bacillota bacterium]|nr:MAG: acetate CoA-transferase alpha subunit [Bacillota bacterium]MBS3949823.1 acetate CoA-transferase subunit alpha [Peptococcaceae bacterium]
MSKKLRTPEEALREMQNGATVMIGGFLVVGTPETLIEEILKKGVTDLTVIGNDTGFPERGIGKLIVAKRAKKVLASHVGTNPETGRQMHAGETEVVLIPQGTLAEQVRAGGAGLGGILTPTGVGTIVEEGKQKIEINGKEFLLELALQADYALIKAHKADEKGNLVYRRAARNFNPLMATAAKIVVAEVDEIVPIGKLDPDEIVTPGLFVTYLVKREAPCDE